MAASTALGVAPPRAAAPRRSRRRCRGRPPRRSAPRCRGSRRCASPIPPIFTAISASALAMQRGQLLVDLRLGLGGDLVRLVARLGQRGVVGGLGLLGPPLQQRGLLDVVRDRVVALGQHRADPRQRHPAQDEVERDQRHHQPEDQVGEDRRVELRHAGSRHAPGSPRPASRSCARPRARRRPGSPRRARVSACAITITAFSVAISHSVLGGPPRPAAALPRSVRPRTSAAARPGTRRCRAPRRRRCR